MLVSSPSFGTSARTANGKTEMKLMARSGAVNPRPIALSASASHGTSIGVVPGVNVITPGPNPNHGRTAHTNAIAGATATDRTDTVRAITAARMNVTVPTIVIRAFPDAEAIEIQK